MLHLCLLHVCLLHLYISLFLFLNHLTLNPSSMSFHQRHFWVNICSICKRTFFGSNIDNNSKQERKRKRKRGESEDSSPYLEEKKLTLSISEYFQSSLRFSFLSFFSLRVVHPSRVGSPFGETLRRVHSDRNREKERKREGAERERKKTGRIKSSDDAHRRQLTRSLSLLRIAHHVRLFRALSIARLCSGCRLP